MVLASSERMLMLLVRESILKASKGWGYFLLLHYDTRECTAPYLLTNLAPFSLDNVCSGFGALSHTENTAVK